MDETPRFKTIYRFEIDRQHRLSVEFFARRNGKSVLIKRELYSQSPASLERLERLMESAQPDIKRFGNEWQVGLIIHQNWSAEYEAYRQSVSRPVEYWKWHLDTDHLKDAHQKLDEYVAADQAVPTDLLQRIEWLNQDLGIKV